MALITCPKCGSTVSEYSETCPNCGYPIQKEQKKKKLRFITLIPIFAAVILIVGVAAYVLFAETPARRARKEWLEAHQTEAPAGINLRDQPTGISVSVTRRPAPTTPIYMKDNAATKRAKALLAIKAYSFTGLMRQMLKSIDKIIAKCDNHIMVDGKSQRAFLEKEGVPHVYQESPGSHDWKFWGEYTPKILEWMWK